MSAVGPDPGDARREALLARRAQADARAFGHGLSELAEVLATDEREVRALRATDGDPLVAACQEVLQASGIAAPAGGESLEGDQARRIELIAARANASVRQVRLAGVRWWLDDFGPVVAFRKADGAPVALLSSGDHHVLVDPAAGTTTRLDREAAALLDETGHMFFRAFPDRRVGLRDLLRFGLAGTLPDFARLLGYGLLGGLLALAVPFASGVLVSSVIPAASSQGLAQMALLLLGATLGLGAFELARAIALLRIDARVGNASQAAIMQRLLRLPAPFFRRYSAGDLALRAFGVTDILRLLGTSTQAALLNWVFGLVSFVFLFVVDWRLGLVAAALVLFALAVTLGLNLWQLGYQRRMFHEQGEIASRVLQFLNGIAKIRANGAEPRAFARWATRYSRQKRLDYEIRRIGNVLEDFNAGYVVLTSMVLFASVAWLAPGMHAGWFIAFNAAFTQLLAATLAMTAALTASLDAIPLYERAKPILETLPEARDSQGAPGELRGAVELSHVSFRYGSEGPVVLDDVTLRIAPGEFVAIVGPSGSGKSTLFRLLLGFEQPASGAVYYDDRDLAGLDVAAVRRQLGVVLQNSRVMPGDIYGNIVGAAGGSLEEAWDAARLAGLDGEIEAMPMGMHTLISEGAGTLSGGQKQRLMIARALARKPRILLFDEATSALDNRAQAAVADSLARLGATRIVIAHRLSTVIAADRIVVLDAGRVVESGSYAELIASGGRFAELARRQIA